MTKPQEILIRGPNWTGDWIMATPGFRALRAGFPEARITLAVRSGLEPLATGAPWFDAVVPVSSYGHGALALVREAKQLRGTRFDLGVCLPDSFSAALLMRLAGVREIIGYRRGWRRALLHRSVPLPSDGGRRLMLARELHVLGLVEALGCARLGTDLELFVTAAEEREAHDRLDKDGIDPEQPYVVLAPGASYGSSKCWPPASFAAVGDALARAGARVVVVGTPAERELVGEVVSAMTERSVALAGELSLGGLKAVLRESKLLVCNDAGARHLAVAFAVPCVVMMGSTSLEKTDLNLDRVQILIADVACRPCYKRECPIDHRCMTRISPEHVTARALPALASDAAERWRGAQWVVREGGRLEAAA
ncbi:MAG: lipopolysaccharide heptosyltransferase II [Deltaproteobacteria bacterium]|nr:lipopolysaccharide heptosyltransferase II [Deltaproteobacteria bacterium]